MDKFPDTSTDNNSKVITILDSMNDKFEILNECISTFENNMSNIAKVNTNLYALNKEVHLFVGSISVLRTCHQFSSDLNEESNETFAAAPTVTNTNKKRKNINNDTNNSNNKVQKQKHAPNVKNNKAKRSNPYSIRKILHLLPQIYRSRAHIEKLDLILRFLHMKEQPCGLSDIHRSLGVSLLLLRKYCSVLEKNKKIIKKKDRKYGLVYSISKANIDGSR